MHKPEFIKIKLPVNKQRCKTAAKSYLKSLVGLDVAFHFGEKRERKTFIYTIVSFDDGSYFSFEGKKKQGSFELIFIKNN